jgi:branched-chain amino acid transport system ATP-binding protein
MSAVVTCRGLDAGYGALRVVRDLDVGIDAGTMTCLIGPNGAGKTTLLHTLAGFLPPLGGEITVKGTLRKRDSVERAVRDGLLLVPDDRCLFSSLTVAEHLALAQRRQGRSEREIVDYFPQLEARLQIPAGKLSGGEQQMLAIGRALSLRPSVLMIDELSMGLAPIVVERLLDTLARVAADGTAVLFVEQHVRLALQAAERALVLVHGQLVLDCEPQVLLDDPQLLEDAYLGEAAPIGS